MSCTYYHVTTPLEEEWVDTRHEVTDVIDRYMRTEGASLLRVTVVRFPDMGELVGAGDLRQFPLAALEAARAGTDFYAAVGKHGGRRPIQASPRRGPIPIIAGTPAEVVSKIVSGLPLVMDARVRRETIPADEPAYPPTTGLVVHHDLKVEAFEGGRIGRALWEGRLLASAVADEFAARGFEEVIGASGTLVTPDGMRRRVGGAVNRFGFRDQIFDALPGNLAETVTARAVECGLRDVHVSTVRGLQDAVVIEATTDTPRETAQKLAATRILDDLLDGPTTRFEGAFLGVVDAGGEPVLQTSSVARGVGGGFWVRPGLGVETPRPTLPPSRRAASS